MWNLLIAIVCNSTNKWKDDFITYAERRKSFAVSGFDSRASSNVLFFVEIQFFLAIGLSPFVSAECVSFFLLVPFEYYRGTFLVKGSCCVFSFLSFFFLLWYIVLQVLINSVESGQSCSSIFRFCRYICFLDHCIADFWCSIEQRG